jgi:hypothetical protein
MALISLSGSSLGEYGIVDSSRIRVSGENLML